MVFLLTVDFDNKTASRLLLTHFILNIEIIPSSSTFTNHCSVWSLLFSLSWSVYSFFFFNVQGSWLLATPTGSDISLIDIFWTFSQWHWHLFIVKSYKIEIPSWFHFRYCVSVTVFLFFFSWNNKGTSLFWQWYCLSVIQLFLSLWKWKTVFRICCIS